MFTESLFIQCQRVDRWLKIADNLSNSEDHKMVMEQCLQEAQALQHCLGIAIDTLAEEVDGN